MLSPGAVLVCLVLAAVVIAIIARGVHNLRKGRSGCSCGGSCGSCGGCSCGSACRPQGAQKPETASRT